MPNLLLVVGHDSALWDPSVQQPPSSASSPLSIKRNKEKGKKKRLPPARKATVHLESIYTTSLVPCFVMLHPYS